MKSNSRIYLLAVILLLFSNADSFGQIMLSQTINRNIFLVNYESNKNLKLDLPKYKLVGYKLIGDSLVIFLNSGYGRAESYTIKNEWLKNISPSRENSDSLYTEGCIKGEQFRNQNNYILHEVCDETANIYKRVKVREVSPGLNLAVGICGGLTMFKDGNYLWSYHYNSAAPGMHCYNPPYIAKSVSIAEDKILFVRNRDTMFMPNTYTVMELDKETGKRNKIAKSKHLIEATYSPDRKFIFYSEVEKGSEFVYKHDRISKKATVFKLNDGKYDYGVERIYWLN